MPITRNQHLNDVRELRDNYFEIYHELQALEQTSEEKEKDQDIESKLTWKPNKMEQK